MLVYSSFLLLLQSPGAQNSSNATLFLMIGLMLIMYFFFIRPQTQRVKKQRAFLEDLTKGMRVVTVSGIHGKIVEVNEHTILLKVDNTTKLKLEKTGISVESTEALNQANTAQQEKQPAS